MSPAARPKGAARQAFAIRDFRTIWIGNTASNVGTWMQNVLLGAYAREHFGTANAVGLVLFAQLGPVLVLAIPGGLIADRVRRRPFIALMQLEQLIFSVVLGFVVRGNPSQMAVALTVLAVGVGSALSGPSWQSVIPALVGREHLPAALSLNSVSLNGSRVVGPILTVLLTSFGITTSGIFFINAGTYLFVIMALFTVTMPSTVRRSGDVGWRSLAGGMRYARDNRIVGAILLGMCTFSLFCLPYVGQFSSIAHQKFNIDTRRATYQWLYATWGLGACLGGLSLGTVFINVSKRHMISGGLFTFMASLFTYAMVDNLTLAFPIVFVVGFAYFTIATSLMTVLQTNISDEVRGRVLALWMMAFGGTVPIGIWLAGPIIQHHGSRPLMLFGAAWSGVLILVVKAHLRRAAMPTTTEFDDALPSVSI